MEDYHKRESIRYSYSKLLLLNHHTQIKVQCYGVLRQNSGKNLKRRGNEEICVDMEKK
jgi:hypothetical protein